jgi:hypothetical protein
VADQANDEILQLARQGNLQALSVYLNRHLIPYGAHVKLKNKEDALSILIVVMQESENQELIGTAQSLLNRLQPDQIRRVKIYSQVLGQKQAVLKQKFTLPDSDSATMSGSKQSRPSSTLQPSASHPGAGRLVRPIEASPEQPSPSSSEPSSSKSSSGESRRDRYSVAEFLAQSTNIKDLSILQNHPFVTGLCPQCRYQFKESSPPPTYWDCPQCGWKDDLSAVVSSEKIYTNSPQTSFVESKRLGDYLIEAGLLTDSQIEVALADQITTGLRFGEVLARRGWIKEETIEYLMKKVIIPERSGLDQSASAFLASSRNLLKALIQDQQPDRKQPSPWNGNSSAPSSIPAQLPVPAATEPAPRSTKPAPGKLPNERETLILPDLDMDEYLKDT